MKQIQEQINLVKADILNRFPNCHYTIKVLLWDDNTSMVECRHGSNNKLHIARFYNGLLDYYEIDLKRTKQGMLEDEFGEEYFAMQTIPNTTKNS